VPTALLDGAGIRILPIDRAKFLAGARFDLRVEATGIDPAATRISITVRGPHGHARILVGDPERTSSAVDSLELTYRGLSYPGAGTYRVKATVRAGSASATAEVAHKVVVANRRGKLAKNVIFFLGDGMGTPAITAARILSRGITEGKYHGLLEMDQMEYRGSVGTSGVDSIATDSANSMSAYMTGHKSSVNAMGVYEANEPDVNKHPRVETIAELLMRAGQKRIGVVTTSEIQDATPAAVWAHTRRRSEYLAIMDQALKPGQQPDVILGGGRASLLPKSVPGSRRTDERDLRTEFEADGFEYVATRQELHQAMAGSPPKKLIGAFHDGNLNVYLDREHKGLYPEQPTLMEMTEAALAILERKKRGFFLMVEGASIDKSEHPLDGPRAVYDTIELDQAIGVAKRWARGRDDTLIVITADHNHSMSIVGTQDKSLRSGNGSDRTGNGVYGDAGYPGYVDADGDGFPDDPDPEVQLFFGWSNHPDHMDNFQVDGAPTQPALSQGGTVVPNPAHDPGALLQVGNLPYNQTNCVHTVEDVGIFASGPGASRFNAFLDNTEVFFAMMDALGLEVSASEARSARATDVVGASEPELREPVAV
jgi:alkaline phosphatase